VGPRRRFVALALVALSCGGGAKPERAVVDAGTTPSHGVQAPAPPAVRPDAASVPSAPDAPAAAEELEPPFRPADVLTGAAAEQAIGESPSPPEEPRDPEAPGLVITPLGVGPFALGLPRQAVRKRLGKGVDLVRTRAPAGEPTIEQGDLFENGVHILHVVLYGGRLVEVSVVARDHRAVTAAEIGVGSTFDDAEVAHGDPRKVRRGWVLSALPGVILAPADPAILAADAPPPEARIGRLIVVGPETD